MQNNRMLQVRHRYLQARRNLEYEKLKEAERLKQGLDIPKESEMKNTPSSDSLVCPKCNKQFYDKRGFSSHMRHKTCEAKK